MERKHALEKNLRFVVDSEAHVVCRHLWKDDMGLAQRVEMHHGACDVDNDTFFVAKSEHKKSDFFLD